MPRAVALSERTAAAVIGEFSWLCLTLTAAWTEDFERKKEFSAFSFLRRCPNHEEVNKA